MPEISATNTLSAEAQRDALMQLKGRTKQPVDRRGIPLPIRKSGYDALDKNSFLKLLVTQLSKQDPTNPMNDREFISQMAQFSSLEQMNNVANSMNKLRAAQANHLIGKFVSGKDFVTEAPVQGVATKATYDRNGEVFLSVNGRLIKLDDITEVAEITPTKPQSMPLRETLPASGPVIKNDAAAAQAAAAYEANQKEANVSRETISNAPINQTENPKGE